MRATALRMVGRAPPPSAASVTKAAESRNVGHGKSPLPGARQEVGDVGVEPGVIPSGRPQAERAVRTLPRQYPVHGVADALVDRRVEGQMRLRRQLIDVKQRQRAAGDLLGAAERI